MPALGRQQIHRSFERQATGGEPVERREIVARAELMHADAERGRCPGEQEQAQDVDDFAHGKSARRQESLARSRPERGLAFRQLSTIQTRPATERTASTARAPAAELRREAGASDRSGLPEAERQVGAPAESTAAPAASARGVGEDGVHPGRL